MMKQIFTLLSYRSYPSYMSCLIWLSLAMTNCLATDLENLHYAQTGRPGMAFNIQEPHAAQYKTTVMMVKVLDSQQRAPVDPVEFHPYEGALTRAPYLGVMVMLSAWLLPLGMLMVTVLTVIDYRKSRHQN
ncbi:hypothetical protein [Undibacterium sp. TJN19]|uniref:hypothetical protein n=1 Tax=Undibacterium sp. TJN19 TaxID=3413055 RepID=UPI003BF297C4